MLNRKETLYPSAEFVFPKASLRRGKKAVSGSVYEKWRLLASKTAQLEFRMKILLLQPTRCNYFLLFISKRLYMFRAVPPSIIRST